MVAPTAAVLPCVACTTSVNSAMAKTAAIASNEGPSAARPKCSGSTNRRSHQHAVRHGGRDRPVAHTELADAPRYKNPGGPGQGRRAAGHAWPLRPLCRRAHDDPAQPSVRVCAGRYEPDGRTARHAAERGGAPLQQARHGSARAGHQGDCGALVGHRVEEPRHGKDEAHPGGEPAGFIIELENGFRIYHVGDTGMFADMAIASSTSPHSC
jgi:hypothetical protein